MGEQQGAGATTAKLDIGSVLTRSFGVVRRNLASLGVVTLLNIAFQGAMFHLFLRDWADAADGGDEVFPDGGSVALYWLLTIVFSAFLMAVVTYGTVQDLRGRRAGLGEWVRNGLNVLPPAVVLMVVWNIIIGAGIILLVVPGVIFVLILWVVFPVMVMERPGIVGSLRRSAFLTKDNRWRLLGLALVLAIVLGGLIALTTGTFTHESGGTVETFTLPFSGEGSVLGHATSGICGIFWLVILGVTYYDLRMAKEGVDIGRTVAVFD